MTVLPQSFSPTFVPGNLRAFTAQQTFALKYAFAGATSLAGATQAGSVPTYSIGTGGLQRGANGLVVWRPENLAEWSEDFTKSNWNTANNVTVISNVETALNHTQTADGFVIDDGASSSVTLVDTVPNSILPGDLIKWRIRIKYGGLGSGWIELTTTGSETRRSWFNVKDGIKGATTTADTDHTLTDLKNGWYLCEVTGIGAGQVFVSARPSDNNSGIGPTGDGVTPVFFTWGAQLYRTPNASTAYVKTEGQPYYGPALTYDPNGNPLGYHHHPSYTAESIDTRDLSVWSGSGTVTQDSVGVQGQANTAWSITGDSRYRDVTVTDDSATHTVVAEWRKDADDARLSLQLLDGTTTLDYQADLDTSAGTLTAGGDATSSDVEVQDGGDFWRVIVSGANNATGNTTLRYLIRPVTLSETAVYDAGGVFLNTSVAHDYPIFTGASAVTINEPSQTTGVNGTGEPDVSGGCTLVVRDSVVDDPNKETTIIRFEDSEASFPPNQISLRALGGNTNDLFVRASGSPVTDTVELFTTDGNPHTRVLRIGPNGATVWEDGSKVYSDTTDYSTVLSNVTDLRIGYQVQGDYAFARLYTSLLSDSECFRLSKEVAV